MTVTLDRLSITRDGISAEAVKVQQAAWDAIVPCTLPNPTDDQIVAAAKASDECLRVARLAANLCLPALGKALFTTGLSAYEAATAACREVGRWPI